MWNKPTKEELNAEIESLVKVPKLSPLTEEMFAAIASRAQSTPPKTAKRPEGPSFSWMYPISGRA